MRVPRMCRPARCDSAPGPSCGEQRRERRLVGGLKLVGEPLGEPGEPGAGVLGGARVRRRVEVDRELPLAGHVPAGVGQPRRPGRAEGRQRLGVGAAERVDQPFLEAGVGEARAGPQEAQRLGELGDRDQAAGRGSRRARRRGPGRGRPGGAATSTPRSGRAGRGPASRRQGRPRPPARAPRGRGASALSRSRASEPGSMSTAMTSAWGKRSARPSAPVPVPAPRSSSRPRVGAVRRALDPVERRGPVAVQHLTVQVEQAGHGVVGRTGRSGVVMDVRAVGVLASHGAHASRCLRYRHNRLCRYGKESAGAANPARRGAAAEQGKPHSFRKDQRLSSRTSAASPAHLT